MARTRPGGLWRKKEYYFWLITWLGGKPLYIGDGWGTGAIRKTLFLLTSYGLAASFDSKLIAILENE